jgi:hypothetical protein
LKAPELGGNLLQGVEFAWVMQRRMVVYALMQWRAICKMSQTMTRVTRIGVTRIGGWFAAL